MKASIESEGANNTSENNQTASPPAISMHDRQMPLLNLYRQDPDQAWITDSATTFSETTRIDDPLHTQVSAAGHDIDIAVHRAVGGDSDGPVPGELLSAALASCMDSTLRVIANRLGVRLIRLAVSVSAELDVRGTLQMHPEVPVGFQKLHIAVDLEAEAGTRPALINALTQVAKTSCVVFQTLRNPNEISTEFTIAGQ